ncbi:MAG: TRAP transporter permease [Ignavibacteriales bacterium]
MSTDSDKVVPSGGRFSVKNAAITVVGVAGGLFHLYTLGIRPVPPSVLRPVHLLMICTLAALLYPASKKRSAVSVLTRVFDVILVGLVLASTVYIIMDQEGWLLRAGFKPTGLDILFGWASVIAVLEMTRRAAEWPLSALGAVFILYALVGHLLPGVLRIPMYRPERVISQIYSVEGLFGMIAGVSATYIYPFVILGAILNSAGTGQFFLDFAGAVAGRSRGGPAKIATISSALFGTVSGSAAANVVATGTFTIPLMIKSGYSRVFAGAIEAAASTGGQIMPPVMAAGAFLMSEMLGMPYSQVCLAALIPAILYFLAMFLAVDAEAGRLGLGGDDSAGEKRLATILKERGYLLLPLLVLVFYLMVLRQSPIRACLMAIVAAIVVSWFRPETRMGPRKIVETLVAGSKGLLSVGMACSIAGIVVAILTLTGLGTTISSLILSVAGASKLLALIMTMVVAIMLGMGLPTTGAYVICASVCAPALIKMGVSRLAAHMFIFYFATMNAITPPVALGAYAAAGIAQASSLQIGIEACRIGIVAFIVPYMFVFGNELLMVGTTAKIAQALATSVVGVFCIVGAIRGRSLGKELCLLTRLALAVAGLCLVDTGTVTDLVAAGCIAVAFVVEKSRNRLSRPRPDSVAAKE